MTANVDNFFEQPVGGGTDNTLTINGTFTQGVIATMTLNGTVTYGSAATIILDGTISTDAASTMTINGTLDFDAAATVTLDGTISTDAASTMTVNGALETAGAQDLKTKLVTVPIGDVSASGSVWVVPGIAGSIVKISNVIDAAITSADAGLTFEIGGTAVTNGAITIANSGSGAGDVDSSAPTALNVITASEAIEIVKDGLSSTASNGVVTFEILPS